MTSPAANHPLWLDHGLRRTNPVLAARELWDILEPELRRDFLCGGTPAAPERLADQLRAWAAEGGRLPDFAIRELQRKQALPASFCLEQDEARPGVLGLVIDRRDGGGLVLPLRPERSRDGWRIDRSLPFGAEPLQDELVRMLEAAEVPPSRGVIPERLAFRLDNPLGQAVIGCSMTVAAVLAVLDTLGGQTEPLFRAACAVVEPRPGGALGAVEGIRPKLDAALRECGPPSLIVCARDCVEVGKFLQRHQLADQVRVWRVDSWQELTRCLQEASLLGSLLALTTPLGRGEAIRVRDRLRWLIQHENRNRDAAELGERVRLCGHEQPLDPAVWGEIGRLTAEATRHRGSFAEAVTLGHAIYHEIANLGDLASDDEEADAAAEYAASLIDNHQFDAAASRLEIWSQLAIDHPRHLRPLTRVKVWNTLARARVVLGREGWEPLFRRSLDLNRRLRDQDNVRRTTNYLVHGLLWNQQPAEAEAALEAVGIHFDPLPQADPWLGFALASVARCAGRCWEHTELDKATLASEGVKHAYGLYLQATGRQPRREAADAASRLRRAGEFLRAEAGAVENNIGVLFALFLELAAAALSGEPGGWANSIEAIRTFLDKPAAAPLGSYYLWALEQLPAVPDTGAAEKLLRLVPYF